MSHNLDHEELVVTQLECASETVSRGSIPHLRVALILLDSAVEIILHRMVQYPLEEMDSLETLLEKSRDLHEDDPDNPKWTEIIDDLEKQCISKTFRRKIEQEFDAKVDFVVKLDLIAGEIAPALKKLHQFRNDTYHRDDLRLEVLRPAVMLYMELGCEVFLAQSHHWRVFSDVQTIDGETRVRNLSDLEDRVRTLQVSHNIADITALRLMLIEHLEQRLKDVSTNVEEFRSWYDLGSDDAAIQLISTLENSAIPWTIGKIRGKNRKTNLKYRGSDIQRWHTEIHEMKSIDDRLSLFATFSAIEDSFEQLELKAYTFSIWFDQEIQREIDRRRGK